MKKLLLYYVVFVAIAVPIFWHIQGFTDLLIFQYLDDFIGLCAIVYIVFNYQYLSSNEKWVIVLCFFLIIIGAIGTIAYHYQTKPFPLLLDAFQCIKCFMVFIFANHYVFNISTHDKHQVITNVNKILLPFLIIAFVFAMINLFVDINMHNTIRNGFRAYQFLYRKSGIFSDMFFYFLIFLTMGYNLSKSKSLYRLIISISLVMWILTWRTRSLVYAPLYIVMYYWLVFKKRKLKFNISAITVLVLIVFTFGSEKIEHSYGEEDAGPRAILLTYGINTMLNYAPIGAGLATYGTDMATKYYSPLYYKYGFNHLWGMSPDNPMYTHDNYWPAIFGEFGIIGTFLVVLIIYFMGKELLHHYKTTRVGQMMSLFLFITLVMTSFGAPSFFIGSTIYLLVLMPLVTTLSPRKL